MKTEIDCPNCGAKNMSEIDDNIYKCSSCGYTENYTEGTYTNPNNPEPTGGYGGA